jgi:hypothetical protein
MTTFPKSLMTNDNHDNHDNEGGVAMHIKQPASLEIARIEFSIGVLQGCKRPDATA